jgi:DnaJ domain
MVAWLAAGAALFVLLAILSRWFVSTPPGDIARAARTFIAVFTALAGTGLLFLGRFGLAFIALSAMVMAVRSLRASRAEPDPARPCGARISEVETRLLHMRLDRNTGDLAGEVRSGAFGGRTLESLSLRELLLLLAEARRDDPPSMGLLEAYLDRRDAGWRTARQEASDGTNAAHGEAMDERMALSILGLQPGATAAEIKAAHRRLMTQNHPDRGGSTWIASRINEAKDFLLGRQR